MLRPIDNFFLQLEEPVKSCMEFLRQFILQKDDCISEAWQYGMPFYHYKTRRFCYLWKHKKYHQPYIGIVDGKLINHPDLMIEKRSKMKILLLNPNEDLPLQEIDDILNEVLSHYK